MSSTPTKQIDGDVSVGRNVTIGGKASVRGSATIDHNLRVKGWLDAPNIKGTNKGLFNSPIKLRETYPRPHDGWFALVGNTLPAALYIAEGGDWVATGETAGELNVDIEDFREELENQQTKILELEKNLENLKLVRCVDEAELVEKANSDKYGIGQQFYIPEND